MSNGAAVSGHRMLSYNFKTRISVAPVCGHKTMFCPQALTRGGHNG